MVCASTLLFYFFDVFVTDFLALAKWPIGWPIVILGIFSKLKYLAGKKACLLHSS
jgi:hypothetical protein